MQDYIWVKNLFPLI